LWKLHGHGTAFVVPMPTALAETQGGQRRALVFRQPATEIEICLAITRPEVEALGRTPHHDRLPAKDLAESGGDQEVLLKPIGRVACLSEQLLGFRNVHELAHLLPDSWPRRAS